jgi:hypothetical protein
MALENSRRELQDCFRPHPNWRYEQEVMDAQSLRSVNWDSFGTPPWESREKVPFGCSLGGELQRILYGEGGGFPQVRAVVSQVNPSCPWLVPTPRVFSNVN